MNKTQARNPALLGNYHRGKTHVRPSESTHETQGSAREIVNRDPARRRRQEVKIACELASLCERGPRTHAQEVSDKLARRLWSGGWFERPDGCV